MKLQLVIVLTKAAPAFFVKCLFFSPFFLGYLTGLVLLTTVILLVERDLPFPIPVTLPCDWRYFHNNTETHFRSKTWTRKNKMAIIPTISWACAKKKQGMLKAEFMKWLFRFGNIKLRLQLRYERMNTQPKSYLYTSRTLKICQFHWTSFLSFSQSLKKFLDCGASLSRSVRFDLCPTNPIVTVSFGLRHRWAMQVSTSDGRRCNFSANKLTIFLGTHKITFFHYSSFVFFSLLLLSTPKLKKKESLHSNNMFLNKCVKRNWSKK